MIFPSQDIARVFQFDDADTKQRDSHGTSNAARVRAIRTLNTDSPTSVCIHTRQGATLEAEEIVNVSASDITQVVASFGNAERLGLAVLLDFRENGFIVQEGDTVTLTIGADKIGVWMDGVQLQVHAKYYPVPLELSVSATDLSHCRLGSIAQLLD